MPTTPSQAPRLRVAGWPAAFFTIWAGQQLSLFGSAIARFALVWWVTNTTGSAAVLATSSLVALVPESLLGPFVGAFVDRHDRRLIMIVADSSVALLSAWLGYLFWADALQIWHVYIILFLRSAFGAFHWPAMAASTPLLVPQEHLVRIAGLNETLQGALNVVSPALGALMLGLLPLHWIMGIDVITAALAVTLLAFAVIPSPQRTPGVLRGPAALWQDTLAGLRYVAHWRGVLVLMLLALVVNVFVAPTFALLPLVVRDVFSGGPRELASAEAVYGLGYVIGGLLLGLWGGFRRRIWTWLVGVIGVALSPLLVGLAPANALWLLLLGWGLGGLAQPLSNGPIIAILQAKVPLQMQGRVLMVTSSISGAMAPLGLAIAGPVADALGLRFWYITAGLATAAVIVIALLVPEFVHIEELPPPPVPESP